MFFHVAMQNERISRSCVTSDIPEHTGNQRAL